MEEIGRNGMTPYNCRHTFITRAIRSGVELPVLETIVGHVDHETTKIYTHLHADDLVEDVQTINDKNLTVSSKSVTRSEFKKVTLKKFAGARKSTQNLSILGAILVRVFL